MSGNEMTATMRGMSYNQFGKEVLCTQVRFSMVEAMFEGTRTVLGEISMPPLVVSEKLGLYWFPSKSPSCDQCVWFSVRHVESYSAVDQKHTKVNLTNGTSITIPVSRKIFEGKYQRACALK